MTTKAYIKELEKAIEDVYGTYNKVRYGLIVKKVAADLHLMDLYDAQIEKEDMTTIEVGSQGQTKMVVNPLLAARDKASRTAQAGLDSLQLTIGSAYKKRDAKNNDEDNDPLADMMREVSK